MSGRHRRGRHEMPVHVLDQVHAAEREFRDALQATAWHIGTSFVEGVNDDPDDPMLAASGTPARPFPGAAPGSGWRIRGPVV